ncbi:MAG: hypothetical protein ACI8TX_002709 [Hyphomicrobiaceae bacterium]
MSRFAIGKSMTESEKFELEPQVSVVLPVRNGAPWLGEAVASIVDQTLERWELIVVDDHSCDDSFSIARRLAAADARIVFVENSGEGLVSALNTGLALARAPYLARMDADDVSHPARLQRQYETLASRPELFAVTCQVRGFPDEALTDGMARYLDWQNSLAEPAEIARERFVETPVVHPSLMLRTDLLRDQLGGWRDCGWAEDWDLVLRACAANLAIARVGEVLLDWRLHDQQFTRVDPSCRPGALERARAHFLAHHLHPLVAAGRPVVMLGSGPIGKSLARALLAEGLNISAFCDVAVSKIGNTVAAGNGTRWPVLDGDATAKLSPRAFGLAAVGSPGGRLRVREACTSWGWREEHDYLVVA